MHLLSRGWRTLLRPEWCSAPGGEDIEVARLVRSLPAWSFHSDRQANSAPINMNTDQIRFYDDTSFEESKIGWPIGCNSKWGLLIQIREPGASLWGGDSNWSWEIRNQPCEDWRHGVQTEDIPSTEAGKLDVLKEQRQAMWLEHDEWWEEGQEMRLETLLGHLGTWGPGEVFGYHFKCTRKTLDGLKKWTMWYDLYSKKVTLAVCGESIAWEQG